MTATQQAWLTLSPPAGEVAIWHPQGDWVVSHAVMIDRFLADFRKRQTQAAAIQIDMSHINALDTAGAMLLWHLYDDLNAQGIKADFINMPEACTALFSAVGVVRDKPMPEAEHLNPFYARLITLGKATLNVAEDTLAFLSFLGLVTLTLWRSTIQPWRLRMTSIFFHMEETGLKALPIVGLLSFLIGVVISYQAADQLRQFGADVYVIDLLAISVLREIGVLMTAIIIAGRSGSAFTAQLGTMQVNQEIDALRTLGLEPAELLVAPRVIAMVFTLPMLTMYANLMALLGGAVMVWVQLGISFGPFLIEMREAVGLWTLWVGLIKAPVFAFVIAVVGCYQGFRVTGSAESVGQLTTRSVVHGIFLVILLDAAFSILFAWLKI